MADVPIADGTEDAVPIVERMAGVGDGVWRAVDILARIGAEKEGVRDLGQAGVPAQMRGKQGRGLQLPAIGTAWPLMLHRAIVGIVDVFVRAVDEKDAGNDSAAGFGAEEGRTTQGRSRPRT